MTTPQPKHRLQITFTVTEIPNRPAQFDKPAWRILPTSEQRTFTFDSDQAYLQPQDHYLEDLDPKQAQGHVWYSWMQPTPYHSPGMSLRVIWREITAKDGSVRIDGAVLNESMEAPLGRLRGKLSVTRKPDVTGGQDEIFTVEQATISDQNGCCFEFGILKPWVNLKKLSWFTNRFKNQGQQTPPQFWVGQPCPDARQGDSWQPGWTPYQVVDQSQEWIRRRYWNSDDPRNPPIGALIDQSTICDWYLRQTHGHYREGSEGFRSPWETAFLAAGFKGDFTQQQDIVRSLWEYVKAQVGGMSPTGQGYIDGRPNHLSLLDGTLFQANRKYRLNAEDQAAPFTAILHEGRPQIGKTGYQFWENFGRSQLHWIEVTAGQFKGAYMQPNGSDFEHCASGPLAAAALLYGDPLAQRQLHHLCEEHVSQGVPIHSTRSTPGWFLVDLADGYLTFEGSSVFGADAERYREHAFQTAGTCWQKRLDQTPYQAMLSVEYGRLVTRDAQDKPLPEQQWMGVESTMQLGVALHAACIWFQLEHQEGRRAFWRALIDYLVGCLAQPGVIDWSRGGILKRYSIQGPAPLDPQSPKSVGERLEMTAPPNYNSRETLDAEGWIGPALAEAWLVTGDEATKDIAQEIYDHQKLVNVGHGVKQFSPLQWESWGQFAASVQAFGWNP